MALNAFQMSFNGLTIGDGTDYDIVQVDGLDSLPAIPTPDTSKSRDTGEYMGAYFAGGREIIIDLDISSASDAALRADIDALGLATAPQSLTELPLAFLLPGMAQVSRQSNCRAIGRPMIVDTNYVFHKAKATLRFHATDPRIYDSTLQTASTGLPAGTGGTTWPITWPLSWGSAGVSGTMSVVNSGTFATRPVIVVTGPVDNPTIANTNTGQQVTFALTLGVTDTLTIDLNARTVLLNGTASRRNTMPSDSAWWEVAPGTTTVSYRANTVSTGSTAAIAWRSAWI